MRSATKSRSARLTRWEILGAWLHVWTPPKGFDVPPVPWRKVALWGTGLAIACAIAAALIVPRVDQGKRTGAALRAKQEAQAIAAERARLRADQRVHRRTLAAGLPLVAALEQSITADARARARAKTISGPVLGTSCEAASHNVTQFPGSRVYKCLAKTATGQRGEGKDILRTGYAFVATIYAARRQIAWCKENPQPDEKGRRLVGVRISPVCAGKLSQVL